MKKTALAALLAALFAAPAVAEGMYAGMKWGKSRHNIAGVINSPPAIGIFAGYMIDPAFAVEAEYLELGKFGNDKISATDVSALFFYPGDEPFSLYAKISYAGTTWKPSGQAQHNSSFTHGLGFRYDATKTSSFRFSWDRHMIGNQIVYYVDVISLSGMVMF